ncbi:MAG: hypothetical protein Q9166_004795 [cf. Caloplaca sp. 2 TL-2023]
MASSSRRTSFHRSRSSRRPSSHPQKTEILINVYDLLPPGKLSSILWHLGTSFLHTGVVINSLKREYAFGGHNHPSLTGVYYTKPGLEPEDAIFRCSILQGFSFLSPSELETVVREVSRQFLGPNYNLLTNNCNHFSSALCRRLTGKAAPGWMNRAANIGILLPCLVPKEWLGPDEGPDSDRDSREDRREDERRALLSSKKSRERTGSLKDKLGSGDQTTTQKRRRSTVGEGKGVVRDEEGRALPVSETTPLLGRVG